MANKIQIRRATAGTWTASNPTLLQGEIGWESDTGLFKIGDGVTAWTSLGYWISVLGLKEIAYTPTFTGFGTVSSVNFTYVRVGNRIKVTGVFTCGVSTAVEARISLPGALVIDAALITSIVQCGDVTENVNVSQLWCLAQSGVGYVCFGTQGAVGGGLAKSNGNAVATNTNVVGVRFDVPVSGWNGP